MNTHFVPEITPHHAWTGTCYVDVRNPRVEDIHLTDIAVGLSREARYGGRATYIFWSVAQHSLLCHDFAVKDGVRDRHTLAAILMHDAPEYLLRDIIRPVKMNLPDYQALERRWHEVIHDRFEIESDADEIVSHYDNLAMAVEKSFLISRRAGAWPGTPDTGGRRISEYLAMASMAEIARAFHAKANDLGLN